MISACCACGGGKHVPVAPSDMPSFEPSLEPTSTPSAVPTNGPEPSDMPTSAPSTIQFEKCADFEGFATHDATEFWSDHTCAQVSELPEFWCEYLKRFPDANNTKTTDACCACGGGNKEKEDRSKQPSEAPSDQPSQCEDEEDW